MDARISNTASNSSPQIRHQLTNILLSHDQNAIRLYDFVSHVKLFFYNSNELRWDNNSFIEGSLFVYERKLVMNNEPYPSYAFAVINQTQKFIQHINLNMSYQADKQRFYYEVKMNNQSEVFLLNFSNEIQCLRFNQFIMQWTEVLRSFSERKNLIAGKNEHQFSIRQGASAQLSSPMINSNSNNSTSNDPILSLKRVPNTQYGNDMSEHNSVPTFYPPLSVEHCRNVLFQLIHNDDHFCDIIQQTYLNNAM